MWIIITKFWRNFENIMSWFWKINCKTSFKENIEQYLNVIDTTLGKIWKKMLMLHELLELSFKKKVFKGYSKTIL